MPGAANIYIRPKPGWHPEPVLSLPKGANVVVVRTSYQVRVRFQLLVFARDWLEVVAYSHIIFIEPVRHLKMLMYYIKFDFSQKQ